MPPSLELAKPPSDLRAARKGDRVTLTWTVPEQTTDRQRVRFLGKTKICRSLEAAVTSCDAAVGEAAAPTEFAGKDLPAKDLPTRGFPRKLTAKFVDIPASSLQQDHPTGFATYAVEVLNQAGRGAGISNQVHVALVPTLPAFPGFTAEVAAQGVMITWQCPASKGGDEMKYLFRIYRRGEGEPRNAKIADVDAAGCAAGRASPAVESGEAHSVVTSYLDQSLEWEKTYFYQGTVVSVVKVPGKSAVEVEGDDTPEVKVFAHDVFPPAVPSGLQAAFSGAGQPAFIDLIWSPVSDADLGGYNIYRHEDGDAPVKVNTELVTTPAYRDAQVVSGKKYFYSVSAVDLRGNESARSEESGESVP